MKKMNRLRRDRVIYCSFQYLIHDTEFMVLFISLHRRLSVMQLAAEAKRKMLSKPNMLPFTPDMVKFGLSIKNLGSELVGRGVVSGLRNL